MDLFEKSVSKASKSTGALATSRSQRGVTGGAVSQGWNEWYHETMRQDGVSEKTKYKQIYDNAKDTFKLGIGESQKRLQISKLGTKEELAAFDKKLEETSIAYNKLVAVYKAKLDDAMPRFVSEIEKELSSEKTGIARLEGYLDDAVKQGWQTRIDEVEGWMSAAKQRMEALQNEYDASIEFYDEWGINVALKKMERAKREMDANADGGYNAQHLAGNYSVAVQNVRNIIDPLIDEFIESFEISDDLSNAAKSVSELFASLSVDIPLTAEAFKELYESGQLTTEQTAKLALKLDDLGTVINGAQSLFDWLEPAESSDAALTRLNDVFAQMGLILPSTKTALYDLVHSGNLTSEQTLTLVGSLDDLQLVFQDTTDAIVDSKEALQGFFDTFRTQTFSESLSAAQSAFESIGLTMPKTVAEIEKAYNAGDFSTDQIAGLAGIVDEMKAVYTAVNEMMDWAKPVQSLEEAQSDINKVFNSIGLAIPTTKDALYELLKSDTLSPEQLFTLTGAFESLQIVFDDVESAADSANSALDSLVETLRDAAGDMMPESNDIKQTQRVNAQAQIQEALTNAMSGAMPAEGSLDDAIAVLRESSSGLFGSYADYARDMLTTKGLLESLADLIEKRDLPIGEQFGSLPGYATGGIATGPTSGYPVMLHGREAVIPLSGGSIPVSINDSDLVSEIRALRKEAAEAQIQLQRIQTSIAIHTAKTAKTLIEWDDNGLPEEREVAA